MTGTAPSDVSAAITLRSGLPGIFTLNPLPLSV